MCEARSTERKKRAGSNQIRPDSNHPKGKSEGSQSSEHREVIKSKIGRKDRNLVSRKDEAEKRKSERKQKQAERQVSKRGISNLGKVN